MLLFKTSGSTLESVIHNKKHALKHEPKDWQRNEILLISKNKADCKKGEKQIQYIMQLESIRKTQEGELSKYWPLSKNDWNYIVNCSKVKPITPFDLSEILGEKAAKYAPSLKPKKVDQEDEIIILDFLGSTAIM